MSDSVEEWAQPLQVKLHIPHSSLGTLARPRLVERLNAALTNGCRLTVVIAPPGYGKSTLLADWVTACGRPVAWLSLDKRDNHLPSFLRYLVAAVRSQFPGACPVTLRALGAPTLPTPDYLAELLAGELADLPQPFIQVLDDYHLVSEPEVQACLRRLLEVAPETLHLALACRFDPPLPLARLGALGQLCELRGDDLRFTLAEATAFLTRTLGASMSPPVIDALYGRTEGWIAALRLAVGSLRGQTDGDLAGPLARILAHADRQVTGYLLEFLAQQPEPVQDFLLKTSILDRFCAPLCAAVMAGEDSRTAHEHLARLSRSNPLLIALDDRRVWYRYHHLLQDLLRSTLAERLAPEEIAGLHRLAGTWYAASDLIDDALDQALAAGDLQAASHLVERFVQPAIERGQAIDLERRLRLLPPGVLGTNPALLVGQVWLAQVRDELQRMPPLLEAAEAGLQRPDWQPGDELRSFTASLINGGLSLFCYYTGQTQRSLGYAERTLEFDTASHRRVHAIALYNWARAKQALGDGREAVTVLREALASGPPQDLVYTQQLLLDLAQIYRSSGEMRRLEEAGRQMLEVTLEAGIVLRISWARMFVGLAHYQMNHLAVAVPLFAAVVAEPAVAHNLVLRDCAAGLALAYQAQGLTERANAVAADHIEFLQRTRRFRELTHAYALQALLGLRQGDLSAAQVAVEMAAIEPDPGVMEWLVVPRLVQARVLLAHAGGDQQATRQALEILDDVAGRAAAIHNVPRLAETQALQALAYEAQGRRTEALRVLTVALESGLPGGLLRTFMDHGAPMHSLLSTLVAQPAPSPTRLAADVRQLLAAWQEPPHPGPAKRPATHFRDEAGSYVEPLTDREIEVLHLLARRHPYKEIARQLTISLATVKVHASNIYAKLATHNRREAILRAQGLGILPPGEDGFR